MEAFKKWLEDELSATVNALKDIPLENRKGMAVAMHRKKARDTVVALVLLLEFEKRLLAPANQTQENFPTSPHQADRNVKRADQLLPWPPAGQPLFFQQA